MLEAGFNLLFALLVLSWLSGCTAISRTSIGVVGTASDDSENFSSVSMQHSSDLSTTPPLVVGDAGGMGLEKLQLRVSREGVAPTVGYEFYAIYNIVSVGGGGGLFHGALSGDPALISENTGGIAKTSFYFYDDPEGDIVFNLPDGDTAAGFRASTKFLLGRVRTGIRDRVKIPFFDDMANRDNFFIPDCFGDGRCFDMSALTIQIFETLGTAFQDVSSDSADISLGGDDGRGDFSLDFLPSVTALSGCNASAAERPAFGFVFGATINGPLLTSFRVSFPIVFSVSNVQFTDFTVSVHPFEDISFCNETQFVRYITVRSSSVFGIAGQNVADTARNALLCGLFGEVENNQDCTDIDLTPLPEIILDGLSAMVESTLGYYYRQARGQNSFLPDNYSVLMRIKGTDNKISNTDVTPTRVFISDQALIGDNLLPFRHEQSIPLELILLE